jgi:hypothetical protein
VPKKRHTARRGSHPAGRSAPPRSATARRSTGRSAPGRAGRRTPPSAGGVRGVVEQSSRRPLLSLVRLPRFVPPLLVAGLLVLSLVLRGVWAALCLVPVLLFVLWLSYLSWPQLTTGARLLRGLLVGLLIGLMIMRVAAP